MGSHHLFLSYCRSADITPAVLRMSNRARVQLSSAGVEVFFDKRSIAAGDSWSDVLDEALARTTHFLAFISVDYFLSEVCQRELETAVARYETTGTPRLLFVLAEKLNPGDLPHFDSDSVTQRLSQDERAARPLRRVTSVGQINFLGPHDAAGRLVRLAIGSPQALDDQLADLVASIKPLLNG